MPEDQGGNAATLAFAAASDAGRHQRLARLAAHTLDTPIAVVFTPAKGVTGRFARTPDAAALIDRWNGNPASLAGLVQRETDLAIDDLQTRTGVGGPIDGAGSLVSVQLGPESVLVAADLQPREWDPSDLQALKDLIELYRDTPASELPGDPPPGPDNRIFPGEAEARRDQVAHAERAGHIGSWEWTVDSNEVTWSDELFRIYGLEPASIECTFESYIARVHPDDRERVQGVLTDALERREEFDFQERILRPDGSVRVLRSIGRVVRDSDGRPRRLLGSCQDITDQLAARDRESELEREQQRRRRAEDDEQRASFLTEATTLLASSLEFETTIKRLAQIAVPRIADWCAIDIRDESGELRRTVAHPDPAKARLALDLHERYPPDPDAPFGLPQVLRTGKPEFVPAIPRELLVQSAVDEEHLRILLELDLKSYMIVPLTSAGRVEGAISFVSAESGRTFGEADLRFAQDLAYRASFFIDNARLFRDVQRSREALEYQHYVTRTVTENATAALFMMDANGRCTYMNSAAQEMTGYTLEEIATIPLHDAVHHHHPDGRPYPIQECPIDRALPEDFSIRAHEDFFIRKDGTFFPVVCAASPIFDREGVPVGTVVEVRDVTEEREARRAIQAREQQFRFLADSIPVQVWTARPDGSLDYVNEQVSGYFDRDAEALLEDGWVKMLAPEEAQTVIDTWIRSVRTGEPYEIEFQLRNGQGEYRWHLARARPQLDASGAVERWFGSNTDIHDAKQAEAERDLMIREREAQRARLLDVFEQAPAFICTLVGPEHRFESANPAYMQLVGHREILGRAVAEALPEVVEQGFIDLLDQVYTTGVPFIGNELPVALQRTPGGTPEEVFVNFLYQPIREADGSVSGIFVHGVDVTPQVRGRQEVEAKAEELMRVTRTLEVVNQELDQFAYVASHDLRAPLRGIANLSQWIEEDLAGEVADEVREHLELLRGRVMRMEGLIDGILEYSRAGRLRETPVRVDVASLLTEVIDLLSPPEGVRIEVQDGMPVLNTERLPLQQIFMNLIGNAIKFVPRDSGRVSIAAEESAGYQHFVVQDNGPGIDPAYHDRIFTIFQTLEARDKVEGTGIGLSLVKKLVESRGGRVWVDSKEGAGAAFHFTWPTEI